MSLPGLECVLTEVVGQEVDPVVGPSGVAVKRRGCRFLVASIVTVVTVTAASGCQRRGARPAPMADAVLFRIEALADMSGTRKAWLASYDVGGRTARFRIELELNPPTGGSPYSFTSGAFVREPGSDGAQLMSDLARALGAARPAVSASGVERLSFDAALLGRDLSRGRGKDQYAGAYTSDPKGTWIVTKVFLADGAGEVFLSIDPVGGWGEFAAKDEAYAHPVLRELGRVLQGTAVTRSTGDMSPAGRSPAPAAVPPTPTPDPLASVRAKLHDPNPAVQAVAIRDVRRLKEGGAALQPELIALTADPSLVVRAAALLALPEIGGDEAKSLEAVRAALHHTHAYTQVCAAQALAALGEPSLAVIYLTSSLKGEARAEAAGALGLLGLQAKIAVPQLAEMLKSRRNHDEGYAAAIALAKMGGEAASAVPELEAAAADPDPTVSRAARYALDQIRHR